MIQRLQGWKSHYGATHRKYLDTPPLKGSCRYTNVNLHKSIDLHKRWYTQVYRLGGNRTCPYLAH